MARRDQITFEASSGNVFADFDIPDADAHQVKANLAFQIRETLRTRRLTQKQAALLLGTSQARGSELYNGKVAQMTYDRLSGWLNRLGRDVHITVETEGGEDVRKQGHTLMNF